MVVPPCAYCDSDSTFGYKTRPCKHDGILKLYNFISNSPRFDPTNHNLPHFFVFIATMFELSKHHPTIHTPT